MSEYSATDPSEWIGTPEHDEVREHQHRLRELMLDLLQEQNDTDLLQYPYRHPH